MIVLTIFGWLFLYICIGAILVYLLVSCKEENPYGDDWCGASYVLCGVFWPFAMPFAFAIQFAQYGIPDKWKKKERTE